MAPQTYTVRFATAWNEKTHKYDKVERGKRYFLYAKAPDSNRFFPVSKSKGDTVRLKIHATILTADSNETIDTIVHAPILLQLENPGWLFELREVK